MSETISVKNNSFFSFISASSRIIPNMIIFWYLARFSGPGIFGKFAYAHTLANTFLLIADFGFDLLLTTEIAKNSANARQIFKKYFWIKLTLTIFSLIAMFIFVFIKTRDFESVLLGMLFGFYMLFNTITNFFIALFKGFEKLEYDAKVSIMANSFLFISASILFVCHQSIFFIALSYVFSRLIGLIYSFKLAFGLLPNLSFKFYFQNIYEDLKQAFIYGILILSISLLYQLDTIILGVYKSDSVVGVYQSVKNFILVPLVIPGVLCSALLPTLTRVNKENYEKWLSMNKIFFKIIFWITLPIAVILYAFPNQIIEIIYTKKDYSDAIPILRVFSLTIVFRFMADYLGMILISSNRQKIQVYTALSGILLSLILNILIIPKYAAYGAGIVTLIVTFFVFTVYLSLNYKTYFARILNYKYIALLMTSIAAALVAEEYSSISIFLGAPVIIAAFIIIAVLFFFTKTEIKNILTWKVSLNLFKK